MRKNRRFALAALPLVLGAALTAGCTSNPEASGATAGSSDRSGSYERDWRSSDGYDRDRGLQPRNSNPNTTP
jgi:hypothetical protein